MASAFQLEELDGGIGLVTFNVPDKKVNTLSREVLQELGGPGRPAWKSGPTCAACCSEAPSRASSSPAPI